MFLSLFPYSLGKTNSNNGDNVVEEEEEDENASLEREIGENGGDKFDLFI